MIIVKKFEELEKYGFVKHQDGYYHKQCSRKSWMSIRPNEKQLRTNGYTMSIVETICEMYKDGVVEIVEKETLECRIQRKKDKIAKLKREIKELENEKN